MRRSVQRLAAAALIIAAAACGGQPQVLSVDAGWVRAMPPGAASTAAYLTLRNGTTGSLTIERITAAGFATVEVHETTLADGVMRMRPAGPIRLAPGESVVLEPGGLHLMLTGAEGTLTAADRVDITFWRDGAAALTVTLPVAAENPHPQT